MKIPKIKICGLTAVQEAEWIVEEQADYAGIVLFYEKSKRSITIAEARKLLAVIQRGKTQAGERIEAVAVTVSPTRKQIEAIQEAGFDRLQVHGELSKEALDAVSIPIIRAFHGKDERMYEKCRNCPKVEAYLFDACVPGSGKTFDWGSLKEVPRDGKAVFLAGGLNAENVGRAIREVMPDAVDVSSGVEREVKPMPQEKDEPVSGQKESGQSGEREAVQARAGKDREKIKEFVRAVRSAAAL